MKRPGSRKRYGLTWKRADHADRGAAVGRPPTRPLPDAEGALYYASNQTGRVQVFRQDRPGAAAVRVHANENRMVPHAHTPLGLLIRADTGGDEIWQLGMLRDGRYLALTADAKAIHRSVVLHPGRRRGPEPER